MVKSTTRVIASNAPWMMTATQYDLNRFAAQGMIQLNMRICGHTQILCRWYVAKRTALAIKSYFPNTPFIFGNKIPRKINSSPTR